MNNISTLQGSETQSKKSRVLIWYQRLILALGIISPILILYSEYDLKNLFDLTFIVDVIASFALLTIVPWIIALGIYFIKSKRNVLKSIIITVLLFLNLNQLFFVVPGLLHQVYTNFQLRAQVQGEKVAFEDVDEGLNCISASDNESGGVVVDTSSEYNELINSKSSFHLCEDYELPPLDFSDKTLLGKRVTASGCSREFKKHVYRDDEAKKVTYVIRVIERGGCLPLAYSNNWIVVPKIPSDYVIEFLAI